MEERSCAIASLQFERQDKLVEDRQGVKGEARHRVGVGAFTVRLQERMGSTASLVPPVPPGACWDRS